MKWSESLAYKSFNIRVNNENLKPEWVEHPAEYTEIFSNNKNRTLFLNIGESWTYGESIREIKTGLRQYDLPTMLDYTFGPQLSKRLNSDFYQYAVPGNCNGYMFKELGRILEYINSNYDYKKIYLAIQMTEPSRELAALGNLRGTEITKMYYRKDKIKFQDWLIRYDEIYLDILEKEISKYTNIDAIVWKNFCKFQNKKQYSSFKIMEENWIQMSARTLNIDYEPLTFQSIGWFNDIYSNAKQHNIEFDTQWCMAEVAKIEASNKFISGNELHNNHPTEQGHRLWAENLLKHSGWINV